MDLCIPALTLHSEFINYDRLIITVLNGVKNGAILPSFPAVT